MRLKSVVFGLALILPLLNCPSSVLADGTTFQIPNQQLTGCDAVTALIQQGVAEIVTGCGTTPNTPEGKKAFANCARNATNCSANEQAAGESELSSGDTDADDCATELAKGCADAQESSEDYKKDKKDASSTRHDLQKEKDDLDQKAAESAQQAQQAMTQAQQQQAKDDQEYQQKSMDLSNQLQKTLSDMDDQRAKGVKEAQQSYDKLNVEYINMRSKLRQLNSTVTNTTLQWNVQCRTAATAAGKQAEDDMDKRMAAEDAQLINFQLRSAAGMTRRRLLKKRQKILDAYNTELTRCLEGQDGPGTQLKIQLDQAKNDLANTTAESNDRAARLETLRQNILSDMSSLESSLNKKTQMAVQQTSQQMQMLQQTHMTNQQMAQVQMQQSNQQAMQMQQLNAKQAKDIDDQLKDARDDEAVASTHLKCRLFSKDTLADSKSSRVMTTTGQGHLYSGCKSYATSCPNKDPLKECIDFMKLGISGLSSGADSSTSPSQQYLSNVKNTPQAAAQQGTLSGTANPTTKQSVDLLVNPGGTLTPSVDSNGYFVPSTGPANRAQ